jgi:hypothetical protein
MRRDRQLPCSEGCGVSLPFSLEQVHDLMRGTAALTGSGLLADLAEALPHLRPEEISIAFNPKQIASKRWLLDSLHEALGGHVGEVTVVGGWIGVLSAMLLHDARFSPTRVTSLDIDPACEPSALALNRRFMQAGRFQAVTGDMHTTAIASGSGHLVINTSAEHIPDPGAWVSGLSSGTKVAVQSNNYRAIPEHISCVDSAEELAQRLDLATVAFAGALPQRRYTRFMVIGAR